MDNHAAHRGTSPYYINRDLSWIEFNYRVLQEAQDPDTPLLERAKFLGIVSRNLDEFMSVRVAGIRNQLKAGITKKDFSGYTPPVLYKRLSKRIEKMVAAGYRTYRDLIRLMAKENLVLNRYDDLSASQKKSADDYFHNVIFPILTPMAVDLSRPFPLVHSQNVYLAAVLESENVTSDLPDDERYYFAIVQVPSILPRLIPVASRSHSKKQSYVLIDELICHHVQTLFSGYKPVDVHAFRLTRDADLEINEEEAEDLLEEIENKLRKRRRGAPVRLEVQKGLHPYALQLLLEEFEIDDAVYEIDGPIDLGFLTSFAGSVKNRDALRYPPARCIYPPEFAEGEDTDFFAALKDRDVLLHHPFESFDAVSDFVEQAAEDPNVMAIKMTLYRVSSKSPIIRSLAEAAEAGKQVTVVVELKARFDEERNITWARALEQAGCHVVYGLVGLKTHAKAILVVRREEDGLRRYVHVGTGNYNDTTAKLYTDVGLMTSNASIGEDASELFNHITGYSRHPDWQKISVAPDTMMGTFVTNIRREAEHAKEGRPSRIIAKFNSLSNQQIIDELYEASKAGVKIDLIVRGVCCLRPGVPGLSENITVRSIVDRYLEHSRIYYFENGGESEIFLASADLMTRNLTRRVELMCPILDPSSKDTLLNIVKMYLKDNVKARMLTSSGGYELFQNGEEPYRSQFRAEDIRTWKSTLL
ncbi:polyphosphate kinase 1 [Saccharibacillus alkalitolerans]|uniref:Polyphosphate kinase n=1 Tax=Saccharibacillus alkalitolerans TaxID=2705290 RepID=A0ABX0F301_9BACL|nr:polyphosphate kinase 1 [Saccharibacillus alkalitolerans]NGZ75366.1 polyphosphate kinase 1 [Saccharibacillus alkalitolerans]